MTRGREVNNVYLCERASESEYGRSRDDAAALVRGTEKHSATMLMAMALQNDDRPTTALNLAAQNSAARPTHRVTKLLEHTAQRLAGLRENYRQQQTMKTHPRSVRERSRSQSVDNGIEL
ncbi:hypothetical protein [Mycobacterium sp. SMC-8]|uniref:hypothetical protein n=1 Tax=Mycobacterium sp. SMC-8 TaxID=2857060 RepID=UPI0021B262FA|nr:hypothetical protein [Mycobacterium sp. SMC-8]